MQRSTKEKVKLPVSSSRGGNSCLHLECRLPGFSPEALSGIEMVLGPELARLPALSSPVSEMLVRLGQYDMFNGHLIFHLR